MDLSPVAKNFEASARFNANPDTTRSENANRVVGELDKGESKPAKAERGRHFGIAY